MSLTIIFLVVTIGISYYAFQQPSLMDKLVMNPYQITNKQQYYRFLTSGFIHADWGHLFFNMFSLYFVGQGIENGFISIAGDMGQIYFAGLYLLGIIVSDLLSYFKQKNSRSYNSLGASGGVTALVFSFVLLAPLAEIRVYFIPMPAIVFGILYLLYTVYEARRGMSYVNHSAHLYGAIFGIVFTALIFPFAVPSFFQQLATALHF